jgi:uncharacterized protein (UPF0335 family)
MSDVTENLRMKIDYATEKSRGMHVCSVEDLRAFLDEIERLQAEVERLRGIVAAHSGVDQ